MDSESASKEGLRAYISLVSETRIRAGKDFKMIALFKERSLSKNLILNIIAGTE